MRQAPSNPKGGTNVWLGSPHGNLREDWVFEDGYIVSANFGPMLLRYIQNTVDVPTMDAMFCAMVAARIAEAVAPLLVADDKVLTTLLANVSRHYKAERYKATTVNGIEIGPIDADLDDYIVCRY